MAYNPSPNRRQQPATRPPAQPWYRRTRSVVLMFAAGLVGIILIIALASPNQPATTSTALSQTATSASASPSSTPTAGEQAVVVISPAAATSLTPATSAAAVVAPARTSAAPVRTSAAPARTTKAPQPPVQTTAKKPSCHPVSSSGNCYKPGEYCSKADHGMTGIDAEGDAIVCVDNNGWRWERE